MLNVTILKVKYAGENEAEKMFPYIEKCDIFGQESSHHTASTAESYENNWRKFIASTPSRAAKEFIHKQNSQLRPEHQAFANALEYFLFDRKKLLWHIERYSDLDSSSIELMYTQHFNQQSHAIRGYLMKGNVTEYIGLMWQSLALRREICTLRDKYIAESIRVAEEQIKRQYTRLAGKAALNYVLAISGNHQPENHIAPTKELRIECKDLRDEPDTIIDYVDRYGSSKPLEELRLPILICGVLTLSREWELGVTEEQAKNMSFEELSDLVKREADS